MKNFMYIPKTNKKKKNKLALSETSNWSQLWIKKRIGHLLDLGYYPQAIRIAKINKMFPPGRTIIRSLQLIYKKIILKELRHFKSFIVDKSSPNHSRELFQKEISHKSFEGVFEIKHMYEYCKKNNKIIYEEIPDNIIIEKPKAVGYFDGLLKEGLASPPHIYISTLNNSVVLGGSNIVIVQNKYILSDELVEYPSENFAIKSREIIFRHRDKAILKSDNIHPITINEGILISSDHDQNYFHWFTECLPRVLLSDEIIQSRNIPLLIPDGLHNNLLTALNTINIKKHPLITLNRGTAYSIDRLIYPSPLSRILDRQLGQVEFNSDIILSPRWVSRVSHVLRKNSNNLYREIGKVFLTRSKRSRIPMNQDEIEIVLKDLGFEIIDVDDLNLNEQIQLFSEVSIFVSPTGAAVTNILFCKPGTKVIIFMSNHEGTNLYFWSELAAIAEVDLSLIVCQRANNQNSVHDDYFVDINLLVNTIANIS